MLLKNTIKANELSQNTKKNMKQRVSSSIFMFLFLAFVFVIGVFADNTNNWSPFSSITTRTVFAWIYLVAFLPLIFICAKEIANIYYKFLIIPYLLILLNMLVLIYAPTLVYFLKYYGYINIEVGTFYDSLTLTNIFAITLACSIAFVVIINTILLFAYSSFTIKNFIIFNLLVGVLSGFYLGIFFFMFTRGFLTLLWIMLIVFNSDIFAYLGGVLFGKHKMAPKISPKKTWEGFAVGQIMTIGLGLLILFGFSYIEHNPDVLREIFGIQFQHGFTYFNHSQIANRSLWWFNIFIILTTLSLLSVFGDLSYSWFKRKYRIKDYGSIIPGHGGIIDRIDSHSVVISFFFVISFFIALGAKTVVFFG